jgi:SmpA / OmlA family
MSYPLSIFAEEPAMTTLSRFFFTATLATLSACSSLMPAPVNIGDSEADLVAKRGQPTHRYQVGNDRLLEYAQGPWGQRTFMARLDSSGKVTSFEQVLTAQKFSTIAVGQATKEDVLRTIGAPSETAYLSLADLEVWTYPYKENNVWDSLMHVHFDKTGVVRKMMNGPDPRFDPDFHFPIGRAHARAR